MRRNDAKIQYDTQSKRQPIVSLILISFSPHIRLVYATNIRNEKLFVLTEIFAMNGQE